MKKFFKKFKKSSKKDQPSETPTTNPSNPAPTTPSNPAPTNPPAPSTPSKEENKEVQSKPVVTEAPISVPPPSSDLAPQTVKKAQQAYNIEESNILKLGSEWEKRAREASAQTESTWKSAGQQIGVQVWRIEKLQVVPWPKEEYGKFYSGDCYIVLNTYKKDSSSNELGWDVHYWLGTYTTQDEVVTATYKAVELDEILRGASVQHREVQGFESSLFLSYFRHTITVMDGGVASGFKHVESEKVKPRLLHLKGLKKIRVTETELSYKSLNSGDVFVLNAGFTVYLWIGKEAGLMERQTGIEMLKTWQRERSSVDVRVLEEGKKGDDMDQFFKLLGGEGPIKSAAEGGSDQAVENQFEKQHVRRLFRLTDSSGNLEFTFVAQGSDVTRDKFDSNDAFIFDNGVQVFAWIGSKASVQEKSKALLYAQQYLVNFKLPLHTPICRLQEGSENQNFESQFF